MKRANFLLCLAAMAMSSVIGSPEDDGRVANGVAINIKQASYMVRLAYLDNSTMCGGALLSPGYVVTAAHCVFDINLDQFNIIADATTIYESGIRRKASNVSIHPEYTPGKMFNDVAVLRLSEKIENNSTLKVCNQPLQEENRIKVSGWGRVGECNRTAYTLQTVELKVASKEACEDAFMQFVKENMFCAGVEKKSTCKGDSGGPAVFQGQLCGIVAFGYVTDMIGRLEAYTDVYAVRQFIQDAISHMSNVK